MKQTTFSAALIPALLIGVVLTAMAPPIRAIEATLGSQIQEIKKKQSQYTAQQGELQSQAQVSDQGLKDAQAELAKQEAVVVASAQRIEEAGRKLEKIKRQRALVMHQSYVTGGESSALNALLTASSLSEFLSINQYTDLLSQKRSRAVDQVDLIIEQLDRDRRDLVTKKNALDEQTAFLRQRIAEIQAALANNRANLAAADAFEKSLLAQVGNLNQNDRSFLKNNEPIGDTITFAGSGTEHGLGMSQYGAKGFAERGMKYQDILKYYYRGTAIKTVGAFSTNIDPDAERYLVGVVEAEMPSKWSLEALKAQAVAARSYAYINRDRLDNSQRTQAWVGPELQSEEARRAVAETRGQVLTYAGEVVAAYFHSTSGGYTENNENVWGGTPLAWLRGVPSPYESDSPHWEWRTKSYSKAQMAAILNKDERTAVGELRTIKIIGRGVSGRVTSVQIFGTNGSVKTVSGPSFKTIFNNQSPADEDGLKNTLFGFV